MVRRSNKMLLCPEPFSISLAPAEYKNIHIHIFHYGLSWVNWAILITKQYEYILLERVTERSVKVKVTCIEMMKKRSYSYMGRDTPEEVLADEQKRRGDN